MTAPQSLSAERREEIDQLWDHFEGGTDLTDQYDRPTVFMALEDFWDFIAAIDDQHAERTRAEVEKGTLRRGLMGSDAEIAYQKGREDAGNLYQPLLESAHAEVEKTREAAILQIQAEAADTEDGETLESLNRVIERLRAVAIEGTGQ